MTIFKIGETAKRNDTGEHVVIQDVQPCGHAVLYTVVNEEGRTARVVNTMLRPVCGN